jgi:tRNA A-37 threonylcarbamoyl transferase component Bud32/tetratricopeptide (TPR) repeat protein
MSDPGSNPAPQAPQLKELSGRIGKYDIVRPLGKGAMGIVYLAQDTILERDVALKVMVGQIADDPELKQRFEREAKAVAKMTHPNVVNVYDLGWHTDGSPYIAMELLKGQDLQKAMRTPPPMALDKKLNTILQTLAGLAHAHHAGIVHRDIKPANIFLNVDGTVKIMDFGVARLTTASMTGTGNIVGTADYMSPEQVKGAKVDGRSDIFSVGCMLYELLAGRRPFHSDNLMAIFYKITHEEPNFDLIPEGADYDAIMPVLKKALAKNLEDRYQSAFDFANDIKEYLRVNAGAATAAHALENLVDIEAPKTGPGSGVHTAAEGATIVTGDEGSGVRTGRTQPPTQRPGTARGRATTLHGEAATVMQPGAAPARGATVVRPSAPSPRPATLPREAPEPSRAPLIAGGAVVLLLVAGGVAYFVLQNKPPLPPPTTLAQTVTTTLPAPPPTLAATPPPSAAPPPTFVIQEGKGAAALRAAQTAFRQGDYDRAVAQAQSALREEPDNVNAKRLAENAVNGQRAEAHFRNAEAALRAGDFDRASQEADAGRAAAPWDGRAPQIIGRIQQARQDARQQADRQRAAAVAQQVNTFLAQGDQALTTQKFDVAIAAFDEALKLDGSNQRAIMGKSTAVQARALAQAASGGGGGGGGVAAPAGRAFASGKTVAQSIETRSGNVPEGFEDSPGVQVKKGSTAADLPGKINFDVDPDAPKAGDRYTVKIVLANEGNAPIQVADMVITTTINGRKVSGPVPVQTRDVAPGQKGLLLSNSQVWQEETSSWSMEVVVRTTRGERYSNQLSWK